MNEAVTLLFGVHAHQPVGNFPEVIEQAHLRCYRPFLHTLHDYPAFRCAVRMISAPNCKAGDRSACRCRCSTA